MENKEKEKFSIKKFLLKHKYEILFCGVAILQQVLIQSLNKKLYTTMGEKKNLEDLNKGLGKEVQNMAYQLGKKSNGGNLL